MSRPVKKRCIFKEPSNKEFSPCFCECAEEVVLSLDEFETIRLIDLLCYSQENAAKKINVARTTVQAIYQSARNKIADALVNSKKLIIEGGNYILNLNSSFNKKENTYKSILVEKEKNIMRIALPVLDGEVFQHFGKTEAFEIVDIEEGKVTSQRTVDTNGAGHCALASFLKANDVDVLICGGIGGGAINALNEAEIKIISGAAGKIDDVIKALLSNTLESKPGDCGCHHDHEEEHECCHGEGHNHDEGECCHHGDEKGHKEHHCHHHDK